MIQMEFSPLLRLLTLALLLALMAWLPGCTPGNTPATEEVLAPTSNAIPLADVVATNEAASAAGNQEPTQPSVQIEVNTESDGGDAAPSDDAGQPGDIVETATPERPTTEAQPLFDPNAVNGVALGSIVVMSDEVRQNVGQIFSKRASPRPG